MTGIPAYKAAVVGYGGNAGTANQFLVPHTGIVVYDSAVAQSGQTIGIAVYDTTQDQYLSQQFTTGGTQTSIGEIWLQVSTVGGSAIVNNITPLTVGVYADAGGEPSGTSLGTATLVETAVYASGFWVVILLPINGLTPNTSYHVVVSPAGTSSSYYVWQRNNQAGGASISADAVAWEDQSYGYMYQVYDQGASAGSTWQYVLEDGAMRWTQLTYNASDDVTGITEYTVDQTGTNSVQYSRTLTYTNGLLTGVN